MHTSVPLVVIIEDDKKNKQTISVALQAGHHVTIGRLEGNTIVLKERNVSRRHACLKQQAGHVVIEDIDSHNGLWVNNQRIHTSYRIYQGDTIRIGDFQIQISGHSIPTRASALASTLKLPGRKQATQKQHWLMHSSTIMLAVCGCGCALLIIGLWWLLNASPHIDTATHTITDSNQSYDDDTAHLMQQVRAAIEQRQWKRAQTLANAVLVLDPQQDEAHLYAKQAEREYKAEQHYHTAQDAAAQKQWYKAWNAAQEIDQQSEYFNDAQQLMDAIKPALIKEHIQDTYAAIKYKDWDEANTLLEETYELDANQQELNLLRTQIDHARKILQQNTQND